jgi:hypothetical protein
MARRVRVPLSVWVFSGLAISTGLILFSVYIAADGTLAGALGGGGLAGSLLKGLDEWRDEQQADMAEN